MMAFSTFLYTRSNTVGEALHGTTMWLGDTILE